MSFTFTVKIGYKPGWQLSPEDLGGFLQSDIYGLSLPPTIADIHYIWAGSELELVFWEHDNEEFFASLVVKKLVLELREAKAISIKWDGLDKYLTSRQKEEISETLARNNQSE